MNNIKLGDSFYHYTWVLYKGNRSVGTLATSEVMNPYQSPLCIHLGGEKCTSSDLRVMADLLDEKNEENNH